MRIESVAHAIEGCACDPELRGTVRMRGVLVELYVRSCAARRPWWRRKEAVDVAAIFEAATGLATVDRATATSMIRKRGYFKNEGTKYRVPYDPLKHGANPVFGNPWDDSARYLLRDLVVAFPRRYPRRSCLRCKRIEGQAFEFHTWNRSRHEVLTFCTVSCRKRWVARLSG